MLSSESMCCMQYIKIYLYHFLKQEAEGLLSNLGLKASLKKVPLIVTFCFKYKMNETVNKFLLVGDNVMPKMHLKEPGFKYSTCDPFTKNKE